MRVESRCWGLWFFGLGDEGGLCGCGFCVVVVWCGFVGTRSGGLYNIHLFIGCEVSLRISGMRIRGVGW